MKYKNIHTQITHLNVAHKNVLFRIDGNVPVKNNHILDDFRLESVLPILRFLKEQRARIIVLTHRGRPQGFDEQLSNKILVEWFEKKGFSTHFFPDLKVPHKEMIDASKTDICLLENLRFFVGEKQNDKMFAQQLAVLGDFYITDAWGVLHRADASVVQLPRIFPPEKRSVGFLIEKELHGLQPLMKPLHPHVGIFGGGKIESKLAALSALIDTEKIDTVIICPPLVIPFLPKKISTLTIEDELYQQAGNMVERAQKKKIAVVLPIDYTVQQNNRLVTCAARDMPENTQLITIGPQTVLLFTQYIKEAKTLFYSGLMGFLESPETLAPVHELFKIIGQTTAYRVGAGGDSVAAMRQGFTHNFDFLSTGGGSTLAYISDMNLPGLDVFL
ncbi:MAG: phosphoglycerate kinase [Candidatus Babeliaceae bacterium]